MLVVREKKYFVIHLEFFNNMHEHMIGLKELTLVNEKKNI
jgi:hypothetical protein